MSVIVELKNISKKYLISHQASAYTTLVETFSSKFRDYKNKFVSSLTNRPYLPNNVFEEFWALKDINANIMEGERLGIIGRNGAGKSTLLKVLTRITAPTTGTLKIKGRVASLLEVGTGFHPELTGRENIMLNGAILGMRTSEIKRKFDQIVDFSEVEKFLDTPVKRYSSGMYAKLGFAIAAHVDPQLLIIDEVLAVGDAPFQKKCFKKMDELSNSGITVIFVSHNASFLTNFCHKGIYLKHGHLAHHGPMHECIKAYETEFQNSTVPKVADFGNFIKLHDVKFDSSCKKNEFFLNKGRISVTFDVEVEQNFEKLEFGCHILNHQRHVIASSICADHNKEAFKLNSKGDHQLHFSFDSKLLHHGDYYLIIEAKQAEQTLCSKELFFKIISSEESSSELIDAKSNVICLGVDWEVNAGLESSLLSR